MKKFSKEYNKMFKHYKNIIMKDAKQAASDPFDYGPGLQLFIDHLYFMRDYYRNGENVWACEIEGVPSREQCLNMILSEYEAWIGNSDKYTKVILMNEPNAKEEIAKWVSLGYSADYKSSENSPELFKVVVFLHKYGDYKENQQNEVKEYLHHKKRFFELLCEYIDTLWD